MKHKPQAIIFLKNVLGNEGFEELEKFELYKKNTNTVLNPEELRIGLQIVPRTILSFLQKELGEMKENEGKKVKIPINKEDAYLNVTKFTNDVYSGEITQNGKVIADFRNRSLPGVGLHLLSSFELYDIDNLVHIGSSINNNSLDEKKIQDLIDERLRLQDLVSKVVDRKLSERQAIDELVKMRLSQLLLEKTNYPETPDSSNEDKKQNMEKRPSKLKQFLDKKAQKKSYEVKIEKSESVTCPDCGNKIFSEDNFSGCICFGPDRNKKIHIRKSENGIKLSFSKQWDPENIEMLLEVLKEKRNRSR